MRALGIALALRCAGLVSVHGTRRQPSKRRAAAAGVSLAAQTPAGWHDDDATFTVRGGLESSAYFANHRIRERVRGRPHQLPRSIDLEGFGLSLNRQIVIALWKWHKHPKWRDRPFRRPDWQADLRTIGGPIGAPDPGVRAPRRSPPRCS